MVRLDGLQKAVIAAGRTMRAQDRKIERLERVLKLRSIRRTKTQAKLRYDNYRLRCMLKRIAVDSACMCGSMTGRDEPSAYIEGDSFPHHPEGKCAALWAAKILGMKIEVKHGE